MLPRAGVSLYRGLVAKGWACNVRGGEVLMLAGSMAILMRTFRKEPGLLSPIVSRILHQFL